VCITSNFHGEFFFPLLLCSLERLALAKSVLRRTLHPPSAAPAVAAAPFMTAGALAVDGYMPRARGADGRLLDKKGDGLAAAAVFAVGMSGGTSANGRDGNGENKTGPKRRVQFREEACTSTIPCIEPGAYGAGAVASACSERPPTPHSGSSAAVATTAREVAVGVGSEASGDGAAAVPAAAAAAAAAASRSELEAMVMEVGLSEGGSAQRRTPAADSGPCAAPAPALKSAATTSVASLAALGVTGDTPVLEFNMLSLESGSTEGVLRMVPADEVQQRLRQGTAAPSVQEGHLPGVQPVDCTVTVSVLNEIRHQHNCAPW
jgi:hypothetical protein